MVDEIDDRTYKTEFLEFSKKTHKKLLTRRKRSGIISMRLRETLAHQMRKHRTELEQLKSGKESKSNN